MATIKICSVKNFLLLMVISELLVNLFAVEVIQPDAFQYDDRQESASVHHIVKRKSKIGRGFGFGKSKPKSSKPASYPRQPASSYPRQHGGYPSQSGGYPAQPAYNPHYNPSAPNSGYMNGPPPAYPKQQHAPGAASSYPRQPAYNPNYNPSAPNVGHMGPPPPYPGQGGFNNPFSGSHGSSYPSYPQQGYGFGGKNKYKSGGFGRGIGRVGSAGFGALAGSALGAYGGYKLGRMVGSLGRNGYYGYYNDNGRYMRCEPPRTIKVDPETNVTYIPLEEDYDKRCSYFPNQPPSYYRGPGYINNAHMATHPINELFANILQFSLIGTCQTLFSTNLFGFMLLVLMFIIR